MSKWPAVVDYLITTLPTLSGWSGVVVYDGPPVTGQYPPLYAVVGDDGNGSAGTFTSGNSPLGNVFLDEVGDVHLLLVAQSGAVTNSANRVAVDALATAMADHLRANQNLGGLLSPEATGSVAVDVTNIQNKGGSAQALVVRFSYTTTVF